MTDHMTRRFDLSCDLGHGGLCGRFFMGETNEPRWKVRRRAARTAGWLHVPAPSAPNLGKDYCGEHHPEPS